MNDKIKKNMKLSEARIPTLKSGRYSIEARQILNGGTFQQVEIGKKSQSFLVAGPQFSLDRSLIINQYPPDGSSGEYGNVLPHLVLKDAALPWERSMAGDDGTPWLLLLLLREEEMCGGEINHSNRKTVGEFLLPAEERRLRARLAPDENVDKESGCSTVILTAEAFAGQVPYKKELKYLAHCRQVDTAGKAEAEVKENGIFSVLLSPRFPETELSEKKTEERYTVHLVSLEGLSQYLEPEADLSGYDTVELLSFYSYSFTNCKKAKEGFHTYAEQMIENSRDCLLYSLANTKIGPEGDAEEGLKEAVRSRLLQGYVPLAYHARTGEEGFVWYRPPFTPLPVERFGDQRILYSADAALIYDKEYGLFDCSYASAWEAGRLAALSDKSFGKEMLRLRKKGLRMVNAVFAGMIEREGTERFALHPEEFEAECRKALSEVNIAELKEQGYFKSRLLQLLDAGMFEAMERTQYALGDAGGIVVGNIFHPVLHSKELLEILMKCMEEHPALLEYLAVELEAAGEYLSRLLLLYPVPLAHLIPDERLLPPESIRFFFLDENWLDALFSGAMSIGLDCTRQEAFNRMISAALRHKTRIKMSEYRAKLVNSDKPQAVRAAERIGGVLLRGGLVRHYRNMEIESDAPVLRMQQMTEDIMLCLFDGIPKRLEIKEPPEALHMGMKEEERRMLAEGKTAALIKRNNSQSRNTEEIVNSTDLALSLIQAGSSIVFRTEGEWG